MLTLSKSSVVVWVLPLALILLTLLAHPFESHAAPAPDRLKGRILLQVESHGEAWYVRPTSGNRYYLGRPADALAVMRAVGLGISNRDFDLFNGISVPARLKGVIVLKVEDHGKAYYIHPDTLAFHSLGRPAEAFQVMRSVGLGITNTDLARITIATDSNLPDGGATLATEDNTAQSEDTTANSDQSSSFRFAHVEYPVTQEVTWDEKHVNKLALRVVFADEAKQKVSEGWKSHVTMDVATVDEAGARPWFLNDQDYLRVDDTYPYNLKEGTFTTTIQVPLGDTHTYTTTITLRDHIGGTSISKDITYQFK